MSRRFLISKRSIRAGDALVDFTALWNEHLLEPLPELLQSLADSYEFRVWQAPGDRGAIDSSGPSED